MSKEECTKCNGSHGEWQCCTVYWREMATYYMRQLEKCNQDRQEDKAARSESKAVA